jgi:hypothetical protein
MSCELHGGFVVEQEKAWKYTAAFVIPTHHTMQTNRLDDCDFVVVILLFVQLTPISLN